MMSKKHYVAIADIIHCERQLPRQHSQDACKTAIDGVAHELADYFASENPSFNRAGFLAACGVEQTPCGGQS